MSKVCKLGVNCNQSFIIINYLIYNIGRSIDSNESMSLLLYSYWKNVSHIQPKYYSNKVSNITARLQEIKTVTILPK